MREICRSGGHDLNFVVYDQALYVKQDRRISKPPFLNNLVLPLYEYVTIVPEGVNPSRWTGEV